jgi:DNA-binding transcriptional LysR family regulator
MKTLVTIVQNKSFAAASRKMGVSRGLLSKHIKQLEDTLNVQLLQRDTHGLNLTERGAEYYDFCLHVLQDIDTAEAALAGRDREPQGSLKILAPICFGTLYLGPFIAAFMRKYPKISVGVNLWGQSIHTTGLIEHAFDFVVRTAPPGDSNLIIRKVAPIRNVVCAAPGYIRTHGVPRSPSALADHACLYHKSEAGNRWRFTDPKGRTISARVPPAIMPQTNSLHILKHLVVSGAGVGILPDYSVAAELADGRLEELLPSYSSGSSELYLLFPPSRFLPVKLRVFIDEFTAYFHSAPWSSQMPQRGPRVRLRGQSRRA